MKHAVILMAHDNFKVLKACVDILDDERFMFFLHLDKKSSIDPKKVFENTKRSKFFILRRSNCNWGGWSYSESLLDSIENSLVMEPDFVHVLQGSDLPIKTPNEIDAFFEKHKENNFIGYNNLPPHDEKSLIYRRHCKHFFLDNKYFRTSKFVRAINAFFALIQMPFKKKKPNATLTSALFSIKKDFAGYLIDKRQYIKKEFLYSYIGEELWIGEIFNQSPFSKTLGSENDLRYIDWKRNEGSSPHTFVLEDKDILNGAIEDKNFCFARKFVEKKDKDIIDYVFERMMIRKNEK